ncbi:AraC family transcriptional regulator [Paraburkholderia sp. SIMBA_054]
MRDTDWPIARIAGDCGFTDQAHLTRRFRQAYGLTPARHRRGASMPR